MDLDGTDVMQERFDRDRELRELPDGNVASSYAGLQSFRGSMPWPWNTPDEHDPSL